MDGKTGYTESAKNCVIEYAQKNGIELIAIVMGENSKIKGQKFSDAKKMFEYVFNNYKLEKIVIKDDEYKTVKVFNGTKETKNLKILYKNDINILIPIQEASKIDEPEVEIYKIKAPIYKGEEIGKIVYKYNGVEYVTQLKAGSDVEESKIINNIVIIIIILFIINIIYRMKKSNNNIGIHGKKKKKR